MSHDDGVKAHIVAFATISWHGHRPRTIIVVLQAIRRRNPYVLSDVHAFRESSHNASRTLPTFHLVGTRNEPGLLHSAQAPVATPSACGAELGQRRRELRIRGRHKLGRVVHQMAAPFAWGRAASRSPLPSVEDSGRHAKAAQPPRAGEPRNASANDGHAWHAGGLGWHCAQRLGARLFRSRFRRRRTTLPAHNQKICNASSQDISGHLYRCKHWRAVLRNLRAMLWQFASDSCRQLSSWTEKEAASMLCLIAPPDMAFSVSKIASENYSWRLKLFQFDMKLRIELRVNCVSSHFACTRWLLTHAHCGSFNGMDHVFAHHRRIFNTTTHTQNNNGYVAAATYHAYNIIYLPITLWICMYIWWYLFTCPKPILLSQPIWKYS